MICLVSLLILTGLTLRILCFIGGACGTNPCRNMPFSGSVFTEDSVKRRRVILFRGNDAVRFFFVEAFGNHGAHSTVSSRFGGTCLWIVPLLAFKSWAGCLCVVPGESGAPCVRLSGVFGKACSETRIPFSRVSKSWIAGEAESGLTFARKGTPSDTAGSASARRLSSRFFLAKTGLEGPS